MRYRFADCELDTEARALCVGGRAVHVERQVFDILGVLAENAGRVVSRDLLLARIWTGRSVSDSAMFFRRILFQASMIWAEAATSSLRVAWNFRTSHWNCHRGLVCFSPANCPW